MKSVISIVIVLFHCTAMYAQYIDGLDHREVNLHFPDSSIKAEVLTKEKKVQVDNTKKYYWYDNNAINHNQGGYKGNLLDGKYIVVNKHGKMITEGNFIKGNKTGEWKYWDEEGYLTALIKWDKGHKEGEYFKYKQGSIILKGYYHKNRPEGSYKKYENRKIIETGSFKNGVLHGKKITYKGDTVLKKEVYKNGDLVHQKDKTAKNKVEEKEEGKKDEKEVKEGKKKKKSKAKDKEQKKKKDKSEKTEDSKKEKKHKTDKKSKEEKKEKEPKVKKKKKEKKPKKKKDA